MIHARKKYSDIFSKGMIRFSDNDKRLQSTMIFARGLPVDNQCLLVVHNLSANGVVLQLPNDCLIVVESQLIGVDELSVSVEEKQIVNNNFELKSYSFVWFLINKNLNDVDFEQIQ